MRIDTERRRATPEGVTLSLRVAGPPPRLVAWVIDVLILLVAQILLALASAFLFELGTGLYLILSFMLFWFYPVAFEVYRRGSTPGKAMLGLQVVHDDGTPVGLPSSLLRNLLRFADFLPFAYGAGLISMLLNRDFQRLGDLAAGTLVIYSDRDGPDRRVPDAPPVAPPVALDRREQLAVIDFGTRLGTWSEERRAELAATLAPLTGAAGEDGVARLLGMANWLLGRRE